MIDEPDAVVPHVRFYGAVGYWRSYHDGLPGACTAV
jgi:hypothetical protein